MSSAVAGYKQTLGADAPPACYDDIDHADCLFIAGTNTAWAHPILFRRIEDAQARATRRMKIIVVDPRRTDTAEIADLHLPIQPGTDVALFNGMLHVMLWEGWIDAAYIAAHTSGFDALKATVRDCTPQDRSPQLCGIGEGRSVHGGAAGSPTPAADAVAVLPGPEPVAQRHRQERRADQPAPGHRRRSASPAPGPFSLTGQPNAMGGREVGGMANLLSGAPRPRPTPRTAPRWRAVGRRRACRTSPARPRSRCSRPPPTARSRRCGSPAPTRRSRCPTRRTVRRALERAEFVVVQEAFATTATCAYADLLLPATTWGEKDGTVTNSERRISRVRPAVPAPGEARARLGDRRRLRAPARSAAAARPRRRLFAYADAESDLERAPRDDARPRPRHHRPELRRCSKRAPAAVAVARGRDRGHARGSTTTACSPPPTAARASPTRPTSRWPSRATRAIRSRSTPGGCATSGTA